MEDKELFNPQNGEKISPKRPVKFYKDWRFYVYSLIALMLAIVSISSAVTACAAINAGVGQKERASYSVAQRKNAAITTDGGYRGYQIALNFPTYWADGVIYKYVYTLDAPTYSITSTNVEISTDITSRPLWIDLIDSWYNANVPSEEQALSFVALFGRVNLTPSYRYAWYFSFVPSGGSVYSLANTPFIYTNPPGSINLQFVERWNTVGSPQEGGYIFSLSKNDFFSYSDTIYPTESPVLQDIFSYYQELGYRDGYDDGYTEGYSEGNSDGYAIGESAGYASGYSEGLEVGNSNGEANGYANGYAAGLNASNYFKSITANNDLVFFDILASITPYYTDGNGNLYYYRIFSADVGEDSYYCWLCYYSTSNWSQWDVYLVWCDQSSSSGFTLDYLTNHSLGVWGVPKSNGAFSSVQSYSVYNPSIQILDNAKVSLVYNVQMMQAYVTLDGGRTYGDVYKDGYTTGYQNGYDYGYELGETAGINAAEPEALTTTLVAVFQQPFNQIYRFFNFNILGLNILGLATGLLSVFIIIKVFKKVLK